jgi:hypothetical protein
MITPSAVVLLLSYFSIVNCYSIAGSKRVQLRMASSNPFTGFLDGLKNPSKGGGGGKVKNVLITGATGLIGTELTKSLRRRDINVRRLTTRAKKDEDDFSWNPAADSIDTSAFEGMDAVIHLAGENIASGSSEGPVS